MKATGIVRRIDDLGRVVIPKEIRRTLRIREGDPLEIFVDRARGHSQEIFSHHELGILQSMQTPSTRQQITLPAFLTRYDYRGG